MSDKPSIPAADNAAGTSSNAASSSSAATSAAGSTAKKAASEGNPAFRMMGLPRLRLPSRNWLIFWSVLGSFAGTVYYDKYHTRRNRQKWCDLVSHLSQQPLDTHSLPRRVTVYLAAPPGDGLRSAREHFHAYVKPVLVAASLDWDVVEGRKEGDVRFKTAERIRRKRKRAGEGDGEVEGGENELAIAEVRTKNGTKEEDCVAGDIVIGRHTWKEYIRGQHEGWLGPVDAPAQPEPAPETDLAYVEKESHHKAGVPSIGDAAVKAAANVFDAHTGKSEAQLNTSDAKLETELSIADQQDNPQEEKKEAEKKAGEEEEKPKPRHPPPYIQQSEYAAATVSNNTPEYLGPAQAVQFPHILGFRNTPIRTYRFLTRRYLADSVGRDVAAAVLAAHRPYSTMPVSEQDSAFSNSGDSPEQDGILKYEEGDWWKKAVYRPRAEHEESVWIEPITLDERLSSRMRQFELTSEDEDRAKRIGAGLEKVPKPAAAEGAST